MFAQMKTMKMVTYPSSSPASSLNKRTVTKRTNTVVVAAAASAKITKDNNNNYNTQFSSSSSSSLSINDNNNNNNNRRTLIKTKAIEVEDEDGDDTKAADEAEEEETEENATSEASLKESRFTSYFAKLMESSENDVDMLAKFQTEVMELEKSVKDMQAQVQGEQDQKAAVQDQYLRSVADFQNFQKRMAKEKAELAPTVKSKMIGTMLSVLDNFDLTAKNVKGINEGEEKIIKGYQLLHKQLIESLEAEGLKSVPGEGSPFDPNVHEAIMREESDDIAEDHIIEEFRKGYLVGEKLVRASMVKVSSGKP